MLDNPFTYLPIDVCGDIELPDFPLIQDCASYPQYRSEVCGLIIQPPGALIPIDWYNFLSWEAIFDNSDPAKVHYLVGRGGFIPGDVSKTTLAGGRVEENRERTQRLTFSVLNLDYGHRDFGRKLQSNNKNFSFWLQTIGGLSTEGTVIGGDYGMRPVFVDAEFVFAQGSTSRKVMNITIDTEFINFPAW